MIVSASLRKSITDLSRRRARTVFTVLTLAFAVTSISFFAIPTLIDRAMQDEVRAGRLADVTLSHAARSSSRTSSSRRWPRCRTWPRVEPRSSVDVARARRRAARARARDRRARLRDAKASTSSASIREHFLAERRGCSPTSRTRTSASTTARAGDTADRPRRLRARTRSFVVSGRGRTLPGGEQVQDEDVIVLYASDDDGRGAERRVGIRRARSAARRPEPSCRGGDGRGGSPLPRDPAWLCRILRPAGCACARRLARRRARRRSSRSS